MGKINISEVKDLLSRQLEDVYSEVQFSNFGRVVSVADGIVHIYGLEEVCSGEMIRFASGVKGMALNLNDNSVGAVIFGKADEVNAGDEVYRTGHVMEVPVGKALLGRVVDALGQPLDGKGPISTEEKRPIEVPAPGIIDRQSVCVPLETGVKSIDGLVPIGRGQRELIIGDRQTGKTSLAVDAILNQRLFHEGDVDADKVYCIYVAIGQKQSSVAKLVRVLEEKGALAYSIVVVASASAPAPLQFLAPYTACAMGEYFRDSGAHGLVVYDDLSKHAVAYRQISLLLKRPPGREAYPGDIFYLHSRLLERAAKLSDEKGGGSLTALPIVETQGGDVSAYIPTNIISITDGQIFLESSLFYQGMRPAINVGLSVSRVGSSAQRSAMKKVAASLKLELAQYREVESFSQFSSDLDASTKELLERGARLSQLLRQPLHAPLRFEEQVVLFYLAGTPYLESVGRDSMADFEQHVLTYMHTNYVHILKEIRETGTFSDTVKSALDAALERIVKEFAQK